MKEKIYTYVELHLHSVTLSIVVNKDLSIEKGRLIDSGYIKISTGEIGKKECFWDNIEFFYNISKEDFSEECRKELEKKGFNEKEIYKTIKRLFKRAFKLNILNPK